MLTPTNSIYALEKQIHQRTDTSNADVEASPLLESSADDPDKVFTSALEKELEKICSFFQLKELETYGELDALLKDEEDYEEGQEALDSDPVDGPPGSRSAKGRQRYNSLFRAFSLKGSQSRRRGSTFSGSIHEEEEDDSDDEATTERSKLRKTSLRGAHADANGDSYHDDMRSSSEMLGQRRRPSQPYEDMQSSSELLSRRRMSTPYDDYNEQSLSALLNTGITLKKRIISLYVTICELKSFIQLNRTGFTKVLKKYDKILDRNLKNSYIENHVAPAQAFQPSTIDHLNENLENIERAYANVVTKGDIQTAKQELRLHLREHVVWDRNTVWREMIGIERKAQAANMGVRQTILGGTQGERLQGDEAQEKMKQVWTPVGRYHLPSWLFDTSFYTLLLSLTVFFVLLFVPIMDKPEQQNCLAMVVFVSLLWATEV